MNLERFARTSSFACEIMVMRFPEMLPDITSAIRSAVANRSKFMEAFDH
eukprot:CAMPEP_0180229206 /NCGR_PEP_ID=MMETSP0987-20121128/25319_1 /TAXON_ID=697907 /ORGANISM="non described non described, Strain CCMP2293" /LENGTH=48 /DNA_ID= /DNA_START= /DNA_END= /DNA_ORIENTATION=